MSQRVITQSGFEVVLDKHSQVTNVDVLEPSAWKGPALLQPLLPSQIGFISAGVLIAKAKQFDDGLMASVELLAQKGGGKFKGKIFFLRQLCESLAVDGSQPGVIAAACFLGGIDCNLPDVIRQNAQVAAESFATTEHAKPLAFYTWTDELAGIFRQDRLLQKTVDRDSFDAMSAVLKANAELQEAYQEILALISRLTNPLSKPGLLTEPYTAEVCVFPPSDSHEARLIRMVGPQVSIIDEIVRQVRDGSLNLTPSQNSGWYDHQLWSLEPLIRTIALPESEKLMRGHQYEKALIDLFKGAYALTRETHVKQLEMPATACAMRSGPPPVPPPQIIITPEFSIEPIPSMYYRRAQSYTFIRALLVETFGEESLKQTSRVSQNGHVQLNLLDEIDYMEQLLLGAHVVACEQLGMPNFIDEQDASKVKQSTDFLASWLGGAIDDPDISADCRMMVPIGFDEKLGFKVWVFLGWEEKQLEARYLKNPTVVTVKDLNGIGVQPEIIYRSTTASGAYAVSAELYVEQLLNRDEFRAICDKYKDADQIFSSLGRVVSISGTASKNEISAPTTEKESNPARAGFERVLRFFKGW